MKFQNTRASQLIATLLQLGIKTAKDMSLEEACRMHARARRGVNRLGAPMSLPALVQKSRQRRRARNTHPGKR
jgi:hypothetical protein